MMVHIVPTVPPDINGLADYCFKLWQHWPQPRPVWKCLAARVPEQAAQLWPDVEIIPFELSGPGLSRALEQAVGQTVVLHFVGHAYQPKGVPLWLPGALRAWKKRTGGRLCVMFHEVYATGTPRQSAYWLTPLSRGIVVQLIRLADVWVTSCEAAAAKLVGETGARMSCGRIVPVGTNIEPQRAIDFARPWPLARGAKLKIAVFGLPSSRIAQLRSHQNLLQLLVEQDAVESLSLIGKSATEADAATLHELQNAIAPPARWSAHHDLTPAQISDLLRENDLGLSLYPPSLLTKSGVYAAFCAHALLTICRPEAPAPKTAFSGSALNFSLPRLENDDEKPHECAPKLHDETLISGLKAQIETADRDVLSWKSITRAWAEVTQTEAKADLAP